MKQFASAVILGIVFFMAACTSTSLTDDGRQIIFEDRFGEENTKMGRPARWQWWVSGSVLVREIEDAPEGYGPRVMQLGTGPASTAHIGLEVEDDELWSLQDYRVKVLWTDRYIDGQADDADFHVGIRYQQPETLSHPVERGYEIEIDGDDTDATNLMPDDGATHFHMFTRGELTRVLQNTSEKQFPRPAANQWYWTVFEAAGDVLRAKTWKFEEEEPGWMLETIDPDREFVSGGVRIGVWSGAVDVAYVSVEEASDDVSDVMLAGGQGDGADAGPWQSKLLKLGKGDELNYNEDEDGNRLPDFSFAGYHYGEQIPDIPVVSEVFPGEGDDTSRIQAAVDAMKELPFENGFRGALLLHPGEYQIADTIKVNVDGVVLRGSGSGNNPETDTILQGMGNRITGRSIIVAGFGVEHSWDAPGNEVNVASPYVPAGGRVVELEDASSFETGDKIIITHPCSQAWLDAIGGGGTMSDPPWREGQFPILFYRTVEGIYGNKVKLDVPLYYQLDQSLAQATVRKYENDHMLNHIGIENLRVDIIPREGSVTEHAETAISIAGLEHGWVRNTELLHFQLSGVKTSAAVNISVLNNQAVDPVQEIVSPWMYNFNAYIGSQQILFSGNFASGGRHHYVVNGNSSASGIVFHKNISSDANAPSEGHRQWSCGILYDGHQDIDGPKAGMAPILLALYNRGDLGTAHGWSAVNSVAWNCDVNKGMLVVQKPPTGQNFAIGCSGGRVTGSGRFDFPKGYLEGSNKEGLEPESLYEAQLAARK